MTISIMGKFVILALLSSVVLVGLNPGCFLFRLGQSKAVQVCHFYKRLLKGGRIASNHDVIPKQHCTSIVWNNPAVTARKSSTWDVSKPCTLNPKNSESVYPEPQMSQKKGDVPNSFMLVAWLRQIVYDKDASRVPVLNRWMMAALKNSAQVCTESKRFLYLSVLFLWPRVRREDCTNGWHNGVC